MCHSARRHLPRRHITACTLGIWVATVAAAGAQSIGASAIQSLDLPGGRYTLVQLPGGEQLHYDRHANKVTALFAHNADQPHYLAGPLTKENGGRKVFAVFDETGRLFRMDPEMLHGEPIPLAENNLVFGLAAHDRIGHILGPDGQFLILNWQGTKLTTAITNSAAMAMLDNGRVRIDAFGGQSALIDTARRTAVLHPGNRTPRQMPNPHALTDRIKSDRFYRRAWALVEANQRKLQTQNLDISDWEAHWTQGGYLNDDYYKNLEKLPASKSLDMHASFVDAGKFLDQQINATLMIAASWFADGLAYWSGRNPVIQYPTDYLLSSVKYRLKGRADPAIIESLGTSLEDFGAFTDVTATTLDILRATENAFDRSWQRPVRFTRIDVTREYSEYWRIAYRTPLRTGVASGYEMRRITNRLLVTEVFPWQIDPMRMSGHLFWEIADVKAGKYLSAMIKEETQHHAKSCFPHCRTKTQALTDLLKPIGEDLMKRGVPTDMFRQTSVPTQPVTTGGVEIRAISGVKTGDLSALHERLQACASSTYSHCEVNE